MSFSLQPSPDSKGACPDGAMYLPCSSSGGGPSYGCDFADGYMDAETACSHANMGGECPDDPSLSFACPKPKGNSTMSIPSFIDPKNTGIPIYLLIGLILFLISIVMIVKNTK